MDNLTLPVLDLFFQGLRLRRGMMRGAAQDLMKSFDVRPADPDMRYGSFSGGNQQKVLLAKWLQLEPRLLLLHEPTQGVDVGAREQIYAVLREARANGTSIICASSDHDELASLADRVLVFGEHSIIGQLTGADVSKEHIAHMSYSVASPTAANLE
jgi:ribose transport system ATP-binding protein